MDSSKVELISKKLVKPSSPTPPSLKNYKLSLIDQIMNKRYTPLAFFYPKSSGDTSQNSSLLEESLSKTLTIYYPFAGRVENNISVDCNDMGATFLEVRIKCSMSEILNSADPNAQDIIFPKGLPWRSETDDQTTLFVAQLSHFDCGGIAITGCLTHKVGDGRTLCNFIDDWAAVARQSTEKPSPQLIGSSLLPPVEDKPLGLVVDMKQGHQCTSRRFVFHPDKLTQLKAKASAELGEQNLTRVEVVSALIYKCAVSASMACSKSFKPCILLSMLNLRPLIGPPVTQNYAGNFISFFPVTTTQESEINFSKLVGEIRKEKSLNYEKYKAVKADEFLSAALETAKQLEGLQSSNEMEKYACTSFCRFPTYNVDFGFGKPIRVSVPSPQYENYFLLMDNPNYDGIEASITLPEKVMSVFQNDPELLAFASPGSSF